MVPECATGQLSDNAVVLVRVSDPMRKDQRWFDGALQTFENVFDCRAIKREIAVFEIEYPEPALSALAKKSFSATPGFGATSPVAAEDDPPHDRLRSLGKQSKKGAAATDLDVVGVCAKA